MNEIGFVKYEGLGNDFVLTDDRDEGLALGSNAISRICDRNFGVGADGLIVVRDSADADARMVFYNPDGTQAEMCGNGVRAFAKYLFDFGFVDNTSVVAETGAGLKAISLTVKGKRAVAARVDMGTPSFKARDLPAKMPTVEAVDVPIDVDGTVVTATCVSMGNPHCVIFVSDARTAPVEKLGSVIERHPFFPERINVEFAQVVASDAIALRVWERGAGETLACGTGACAAAVAAARTGRTGRKIRVRLPGGELQIEWEEDDHVFMTGPVTEVFRGTLDLDSFTEPV